ncbi:M61 family metallopeptidase [Gloeobacter morelensis]|uniref:M61 family metallopeptidase n=1 Tax=Gloeobacter morelensis MG652769 TaxID=2781736 RepID=A0ABY3PR06_9CYAN|nr:M61 family metallopeptidase [Gloeobacter morelensis]UFP96072.1 M61 family metallopeptidase [Gloeobacter morelensis MG652769]
MAAAIRYRVSMEKAHAHLFDVEMTIEGWSDSALTLKLPVWTPGSYLVREYSRHLQDFEAVGATGPLRWQKLAKQTWWVDVPTDGRVQVRYRIYANELTVRTSHLDTTHAFFNGACLFFYVPGCESSPCEVSVVPLNPDWRISTALAAGPGRQNTFQAASYDELVDSPFEVGTHRIVPFTVQGKPHTLAVWGKSNLDYNRFLPDLESIIATEAKLFGSLPYEHYLFLVHFADGYGGLEHRNSTTLLYPRFELRGDEKYFKFLNLVAHEFFHLWNVKRIRPSTLDRFEYAHENYTRSLWFMEGATSYYDELIPLRAGIYDATHYLKQLGIHITRLLTTPGRAVQSLAESSFDTWIKLYRPNENSLNSQVSYYLKGQLVCLLLDLEIRLRTGGERSLDDAMRHLWQHYGAVDTSFPEAELEAIIARAVGLDLQLFFDHALRSTGELDFEGHFAPFGLQLVPTGTDGAPPYLGLRTQEQNGRTTVQNVEAGSPAQLAGVATGDELVALAGWKVTHGTLKDRLADWRPGDRLEVTYFRREELSTTTVRLGEARPTTYTVERRAEATAQERERLTAWLGQGGPA